ncbi:MAG: hypothetical protein F6K09_19060 [Merismopedia sp. SIO2A8]|nr:hypothetical protein [Symploca sp. SIO2B6]NET50746.1 hypothetical protein [Merismopedia sp. SIO2A8]
MTTIYIRHANGQIMEVQNWDTLTDYGAMVTRPLSESEQERYLALKSIRLKDSDIWQVFHPKVLPTPTATPSAPIDTHTSGHGRGDRSQLSSSHPRSSQSQSPQSRASSQTTYPRQRHASGASHITPDIEISTRELSKNALLHIIQKACGRDIEVLRGASRDDLLSLASGILPPAGVPVNVMPQLGVPFT